jgi:Flp pilus assembly pilin Flp
MTYLKNKLNEFWQDESGQGTMEYIMLIVLVVGAALLLRGRATTWLGTTSQKVDDGLGNINTNL